MWDTPSAGMQSVPDLPDFLRPAVIHASLDCHPHQADREPHEPGLRTSIAPG